ncbi:hypothetical protein BDZ91DRAFT_763587 [Kalaharituber pfeilii]|nr:hypothetical protein BDZ91DRAFT_763587 [Kalaharituber pfeilii]
MYPHALKIPVFFDAKNATSVAEVDGLRNPFACRKMQQSELNFTDMAGLPLWWEIWQNELNSTDPTRGHEKWQHELNLTGMAGPTRWHEIWQNEPNLTGMAHLPRRRERWQNEFDLTGPFPPRGLVGWGRIGQVHHDSRSIEGIICGGMRMCERTSMTDDGMEWWKDERAPVYRPG